MLLHLFILNTSPRYMILYVLLQIRTFKEKRSCLCVSSQVADAPYGLDELCYSLVFPKRNLQPRCVTVLYHSHLQVTQQNLSEWISVVCNAPNNSSEENCSKSERKLQVVQIILIMHSMQHYLCVVGTDVKLAGDVDEPLLGSVKVRDANAPWAINDVYQVIDSRAAACTHKDIYTVIKEKSLHSGDLTDQFYDLLSSKGACHQYLLSHRPPLQRPLSSVVKLHSILTTATWLCGRTVHRRPAQPT